MRALRSCSSDVHVARVVVSLVVHAVVGLTLGLIAHVWHQNENTRSHIGKQVAKTLKQTQ